LTRPQIEPEVFAGSSSRRSALNAYEKLAGAKLVGGGAIEADGRDAARHVTAREFTADEFARGEMAAAPWWLWWNVLSLDAPMVAVAWALVFARSAGVAVPSAELVTLGLVVWLIYTVDRLLDGRPGAAVVPEFGNPGAFGSPLRQRHVFHRVHARSVACVAAGVSVFAAIVVLREVDELVLRLAVPLGLILVFYMAWVHLGRGRLLPRLPKEVAVGGIFAAGVALPVWSRLETRSWEFLLLVALFAAVCMLNCVAIEEWEHLRWRRDRDFETSSDTLRAAATDFGPGSFAVALAICAALLTPVVRMHREFSAIGLAIAVSALLILILDSLRERISTDALRVLVDVALLVPAIVVLACQ
jgi:hypothetical protein